MTSDLSDRLASHLKSLRVGAGLSLDQLAAKSTVSRATLSRIEKAEVSPTAEVLGRLSAAYGLPMSQLLSQVERGFTACVPYADQAEWTDPETGYTRRQISPPATGLSAELLECHLPPSTTISYPSPPRAGQEHHLVVLDGALTITVEGVDRHLSAGDCLRYRLYGSSRFTTPSGRGARYILALV